MTALGSLLIILALSYLITRLATTALAYTGLSRDLAQLQSVSAFTGVGFTTDESERIVNHPVRRRILILLMVLGNAGIVTAVASLILSFAGVEGAKQGAWRIAGIAAAVIGFVLVMRLRHVQAGLEKGMRWALRRWTRIQPVDFVRLLGLTGRWRVSELRVRAGDWVEDRRLDELNLFDEGVTVLGVHRPTGDYLGVPRGETRLHEGDRLILYGRQERLEELERRRRDAAGEQAHAEARRQHAGERQDQERRQRRAAQGSSAESPG